MRRKAILLWGGLVYTGVAPDVSDSVLALWFMSRGSGLSSFRWTKAGLQSAILSSIDLGREIANNHLVNHISQLILKNNKGVIYNVVAFCQVYDPITPYPTAGYKTTRLHQRSNRSI